MAEKQLTCSEKLQELEAILIKVKNGPNKIGTITAGPYNNMYRVSVNGEETITPYDTRQTSLARLKIGDFVMVAQQLITQALPKQFLHKEKPVEFTPIDWSEIGGMKSQVDSIKELVELSIKHKDICKEFNLPANKGVLLYGPPGCGKTIIAKAIATSVSKGHCITEDSFIYEKGGEMLSPYIGMAEIRIKDMFERCRANYKKTSVQSILFIDEAEAIMPTRGSRRSSDVEKTIVPTFLAEMDGFADNNPFVILATNHPDSIDPAIQREGRINLKVGINRPTKEDVVEIFEIHLKKTKVSGNIQTISDQAATVLFDTVKDVEKKVSGAMIQNIVNGGIQHAIKRRIADRKALPLTIEDLETFIVNL